MCRLPLQTDGSGNATLSIRIPNNNQIVGVRAYHQFFVADSAANNKSTSRLTAISSASKKMKTQ